MSRTCEVCEGRFEPGEGLSLSSSSFRCWACEADEEATKRLRRQLHTRIGAAPLLAPLGLLLALPVWVWLYGTRAQLDVFWLVWIPVGIGVLAGLAAAVDNLWTVLIIDRYEGMLEVRPAERGALTLSAVITVMTCMTVTVAGALLGLTPAGWRWLESVLPL